MFSKHISRFLVQRLSSCFVYIALVRRLKNQVRIIWNWSKIYFQINQQSLKVSKSRCNDWKSLQLICIYRSRPPDVFLGKGVLKICGKFTEFTGEHPCWSVILVKLLCNLIEIALWHGCFPENLLHILYKHLWRAASAYNTSGGLLL